MTALDQLRSRLGDRYIIERELGRGGMGAVYLARDVRLDRLVALKVLPAEYAVAPALRERFVRETRTAAGFSHPNIVPVYAIEESVQRLSGLVIAQHHVVPRIETGCADSDHGQVPDTRFD